MLLFCISNVLWVLFRCVFVSSEMFFFLVVSGIVVVVGLVRVCSIMMLWLVLGM